MILAGPAIQLVSVDPSFHPRTGFRVEETYRGTKQAIYGKAAECEGLNLQYKITQNGASYVLVVSRPDLEGRGTGSDPTSDSEVATVWEFDMEDEMVSIWALKSVDAALQQISVGALPRQQSPGATRKLVEDAVKKGDSLSVLSSISINNVTQFSVDTMTRVYQLLARGVETVPIKRPVISRTRTFAQHSDIQTVIDFQAVAYTRSALIENFKIPSTIVNKIPFSPDEIKPPIAPPTDSFWGWRLRLDRTRYIGSLNKTEESLDWVFGAWPLLAFTRITAIGET